MKKILLILLIVLGGCVTPSGLNNYGIVDRLPNGAILARCAQPDPTSLKKLKDAGYDIDYKLNTGNTYENYMEQDNFGGILIYDPYPGFYCIPSKDSILSTVFFIHKLLEEGNNVFVHCTHGRDRTGLVIGTYRIIYNGWTFEQVQKERHQYGANWFIDISDRKIIYFLKHLRPDIHTEYRKFN